MATENEIKPSAEVAREAQATAPEVQLQTPAELTALYVKEGAATVEQSRAALDRAQNV